MTFESCRWGVVTETVTTLALNCAVNPDDDMKS